MRDYRDCGRWLFLALFFTLAAPTCGGNGGGAASQFCGEWAAAFCKRVWACTTDPANNPFAGSSEAECRMGYSMLCSQQQPAGQTFDVSCAGKQVNEAAKTACLNKLNTVTCDDFNSATYDDDCDLVCTTGGGVGSGGSGGSGGGGTGGSSSCGSVQPCGGSLVGTWTITGVCLNATDTSDPTCPGYALSNLSATESGTLSFASGGTYTANVSATLQYTETIPQSCIDPSTCADIAPTYALLGIAASCTGTTVCTCSIAIASNSSEAGTYTTSGTTVTSTDSLGYVDTMAYCVQGNSVHFLSYNSAGQVTTEEIAQKQ
jgi:hypothetical protein